MNEPPLRDDDPHRGDPLAALTRRMRQLRHNSGLSYERMARNIYRSKTALAMADTGERVPNWDVVSDYVRACGGDPDELAQLELVWRAAATRRPAPRQRTTARPARTAEAGTAPADPPDTGTDETIATSGFPVDATWVWFITALALAAVVIIVLA